MQVPLRITIRNIRRRHALEGDIQAAVARLERVHPRITSCRVAVDRSDRPQRQGRRFRVKVEVRAPPHAEAVSTLHREEVLRVALREAFDSVRRQLESRFGS